MKRNHDGRDRVTRRWLVKAAAPTALLATVPLRAPGKGLTCEVERDPLSVGAIAAETLRMNRILADAMREAGMPRTIEEVRQQWNSVPQWSPEMIAAGTPGMTLPPLPPESAVSHRKISIAGGEAIDVAILSPPGNARGTYFYIHGGGWVAESADIYFPFLWLICRTCALVVVAPNYRLAPEHPFPVGPDDVKAAALWLRTQDRAQFPRPMVIGGDSAGAHLAAVTLQRLRDEDKISPFVAADLVYGCYDMGMTPSVRLYGDEPPLTSKLMNLLQKAALGSMDPADPKISPLYGKLHDMPPAMFTVGSSDILLDDTLFMYARWRAAGRKAELALYPGGVHGFDVLPLKIAQRSLERRMAFLSRVIGST